MKRTEGGKKKFPLGMLKNQPDHSPKNTDTINLSIKAEFCKVARISRKQRSGKYRRSFQKQVEV